MDNLLSDLSVVGQVPRHGRISSNRDGLYLERPGPLLCCKRYLRGDSRTQLIRDLKQLVERVALLHDSAPELMQDLVGECVAGLDRLHDTTYSKDAVMRSQLKIQAGNLRRSLRGEGTLVSGGIIHEAGDTRRSVAASDRSRSRARQVMSQGSSYASGSSSQASQAMAEPVPIKRERE